MIIGSKQHLISSLCYKSVKLTFSPTPPSLNALLISPCQAVTMTTSENVILYDMITRWNHQTKVPKGGVQPNKALFGVGPLTKIGVLFIVNQMRKPHKWKRKCQRICFLHEFAYGAIQVLRNADGWVGDHIFRKKRYESVRFNVISGTRGGRGSNFQKKSVT